ncbi:MAG: hypothetical protein M0P12_00145 [Paludibacteraceae bacterium]|nr:hypothetical protein [Paludibacteraceae bacterium]
MNKHITGKIPEDITIYLKVKEEVSQAVSEDEVQMVFSMPGFVFETGNKKTEGTARSWAFGWSFDNEEYQKALNENRILNQKNVPTCGYRLVGLEKRCEGGRAWKVLDSRGNLFDLREDVLLDILQNAGVENGIIKADLLWATVGSQMKLIRKGSSLHQRILDYTSDMKVPKVKEFEVGHVYTDAKGEINQVFVGYYDAVNFNKGKTVRYKNGLVFYRLYYCREDKDRQQDLNLCDWWRLSIKKSSALTKDLGILKIPEIFLTKCRKNIWTCSSLTLSSYEERRNQYSYGRHPYGYSYEHHLGESSFLFNMEDFADTIVDNIDKWESCWYDVVKTVK